MRQILTRSLLETVLPPAFSLREECFALAPSIFGKCLKRALSLPLRACARPAMVNVARMEAEMSIPAHRNRPWRRARLVSASHSDTNARSDEAVVWPARSDAQHLVALRDTAHGAVIGRHEHQVAPENLRRPDHGRENPRRRRARGR